MNARSDAGSLEEAFVQCRDLEGSLGERLDAFAAAVRRVTPEFADAVERLVARLSLSGAGTAAPKPGETMPDFVLPDDAGRFVSLENLVRAGPVAVTFNRGHWCPYCRISINALARAHDEVAAEGAQIVAIVPDRQQFAAELGRIECSVSDPDRSRQRLCAVVESRRLGWRRDGAHDGSARPRSADLSGQRVVDAADTGDLRGRWGRAGQGTFRRPGLPQAHGDRRLARRAEVHEMTKARFVDPDYRKRIGMKDLIAAVKSARSVDPR